MKIKFEATKSYEIRATGIPAWLLRSLDSGSKTAGVMEDLLEETFEKLKVISGQSPDAPDMVTDDGLFVEVKASAESTRSAKSLLSSWESRGKDGRGGTARSEMIWKRTYAFIVCRYSVVGDELVVRAVVVKCGGDMITKMSRGEFERRWFSQKPVEVVLG